MSRNLNSARPSRRQFMERMSVGLAGMTFGRAAGRVSAGVDPSRRLRVAAVVTEFSYRSHAHVILENFLEPYLFNGKKTDSGMDVVSLYVDQFPSRDMARDVAKAYGIKIYPTIGEALRVGGDRLAVDAVLSIGEQGRYPTNAKRQVEYPRKRFFDDIVAEFRRSGATAPVFNDKHLSYRADWAHEMVATARKMGFSLMAASSVPLAERRPPLELPPGARITEAVSLHGGGLEGYDFHGLEVLQSMVESRAGGETGIKEVEFLDGDRLWRAADEGRWSPELADAARATDPDPARPGPLREVAKAGGFRREIHGILVTYKDGLRGMVLNAARDGTHWHFACRTAGDPTPRATSFYVGPWENRNLFKALAHAIQVFFRERRAPFPIERTLLTTCALEAAMESRFQGQKAVTTPYLGVAYQPLDFRPMREMGESWRILTPGTPEPGGIDTTIRDRRGS
jgi:hypothetical protein